MSNINGVVDLEAVVRTPSELMSVYDRLPAENRKAYREAALNLTPDPGSWSTWEGTSEVLVETLAEIQRDSAVATYGVNYPVDIPPVRV